MKWKCKYKTAKHPGDKPLEQLPMEVDAATREEALAKVAEAHGINPTKITHFVEVTPA